MLRSASSVVLHLQRDLGGLLGPLYGHSPGRPKGSSTARGYKVGMSGGRPKGTTANEGLGPLYGHSPGRPKGSSTARGYKVGMSGGRPKGTTANEGYGVGTSGGRPSGTTPNEGYGVGTSGGRPKGRHAASFNDTGDLPKASAANLNADLLNVCKQRIKQQRTFDRKPLGIGICYNCGHVLCNTVDGTHTFLVDKPSDMTAAAR